MSSSLRSPPSKVSRIAKMSNESNFSTFLRNGNRKIFNLMLSHLSIDDIKTLALVSKDLNCFISKSKHVIDRMKLQISENWEKEFEFDDLNKLRKYNYLHVNKLLKKTTEIVKTVECYSNSLTTIITTFDIEVRKDVFLKNVKHLEIYMNHSCYLENGLLSAVKSLKSLRLTGFLDGNPRIAINCLRSNPGLKSLDLEGECASKIINNINVYLPEFQLDVFRVNTDAIQHRTDDFIRSLKSFLSSQPRIKELKLMKIDFSVLSDILRYMDRLEKLSYGNGMPNNSWNTYGGGNIPILSTIKELNLICDEVFVHPLKVLLCRMPNLKKLYFAIPNEKIIRIALTSRLMLNELSYAFFSDDIDHEKIEMIKCISFNKSLIIKQI